VQYLAGDRLGQIYLYAWLKYKTGCKHKKYQHLKHDIYKRRYIYRGRTLFQLQQPAA
jgi:hypothetical protein